VRFPSSLVLRIGLPSLQRYRNGKCGNGEHNDTRCGPGCTFGADRKFLIPPDFVVGGMRAEKQWRWFPCFLHTVESVIQPSRRHRRTTHGPSA
jgi:hypothetical protein